MPLRATSMRRSSRNRVSTHAGMPAPPAPRRVGTRTQDGHLHRVDEDVLPIHVGIGEAMPPLSGLERPARGVRGQHVDGRLGERHRPARLRMRDLGRLEDVEEPPSDPEGLEESRARRRHRLAECDRVPDRFVDERPAAGSSIIAVAMSLDARMG